MENLGAGMIRIEPIPETELVAVAAIKGCNVIAMRLALFAALSTSRNVSVSDHNE